MPYLPSHRSVVRFLADCLFLPLAAVFTVAGAAFGCSGSVSVNTNPPDPDRALGTYKVDGTFAESESNVFFGYWLDGDNGIDPVVGQTLPNGVSTIRCRAEITIVPNSILYEETATENATGNSITVSISGTWAYDSQNRLSVNWGAAFVTESTFPTDPPFALSAVGTEIQDAQPNDLIFCNSAWTELTNVAPGPLNGTFSREN